jgi:TonB-dependent SusC/RagA subfamily outer membrane receptor
MDAVPTLALATKKAAPLVAITDIESVQVLKSGQETAAYGMQGSNGVIIIRTKK